MPGISRHRSPRRPHLPPPPDRRTRRLPRVTTAGEQDRGKLRCRRATTQRDGGWRNHREHRTERAERCRRGAESTQESTGRSGTAFFDTELPRALCYRSIWSRRWKSKPTPGTITDLESDRLTGAVEKSERQAYEQRDVCGYRGNTRGHLITIGSPSSRHGQRHDRFHGQGLWNT